jgi:hypothetical protein
LFSRAWRQALGTPPQLCSPVLKLHPLPLARGFFTLDVELHDSCTAWRSSPKEDCVLPPRPTYSIVLPLKPTKLMSVQRTINAAIGAGKPRDRKWPWSSSFQGGAATRCQMADGDRCWQTANTAGSRALDAAQPNIERR